MRKKTNKVIAILCADIHLSLKPPIWRSAEPDWFEAMKRPLDEIKFLQRKFDCPVICAGDVFDKWNSSAELINFAIDNLPQNFYSIPGQHDLPLHNYQDIEKSAYWTLVEASKIINLEGGNPLEIKKYHIKLYGFPYGVKIKPLERKTEGYIHIAVIHEYRCSNKNTAYPNAPEESYLRMNEKNLIGYDVIVYGDNHKGFITKVNSNSTIFNCGTLMRRHSDEIDYKPQTGLLYEDGRVETYYLDTLKDKYLETSDNRVVESNFDMKELFKALEKLDDTALDFVVAMKRYLKDKKIDKKVTDIILECMENEK